MAILKKDMIYERLRRRIVSGEYPHDGKLPRELDLAKAEKVAFLTLRSALGRLEAEKLIVRIPGKGTFINCPPGGSEGEELKKAVNFRLIIPGYSGDISGERLFIRQLVAGCAQAAYLHNMHLDLSGDDIDAGELLNQQRAGALAGVIWDRADPEDEAVIGELAAGGMPQVTLNRSYENIPSVSCDYDGSLQKAVRFLTNIGHRNILLIDQQPRLGLFAKRQAAFREYIEEAQCAPDCVLTPPPNVTTAEFNAAMRQRTMPDVVICSYSFIDQFYEWVCDRQLRIPRDISVVLWGESDRFFSGGVHPFSILTEARTEVGINAVEQLYKQLNAAPQTAERQNIPGVLLVLKGCGTPRQKK